MAQQLETDIVVNAKANQTGFNKVKSQLQSMVSYAEQLSKQIIDFGKESA